MCLPGTTNLIGEMAHIVPWSARGPRGEHRLPDDELNDTDNLILLCPDHHKEVDENR